MPSHGQPGLGVTKGQKKQPRIEWSVQSLGVGEPGSQKIPWGTESEIQRAA